MSIQTLCRLYRRIWDQYRPDLFRAVDDDWDEDLYLDDEFV